MRSPGSAPTSTSGSVSHHEPNELGEHPGRSHERSADHCPVAATTGRGGGRRNRPRAHHDGPGDRGARRVGPQPPPGPEGARRPRSRCRHDARRARGARAPGRLHRLGLHGERQRNRDVLDVRSRRGPPDAQGPPRRRLRRPVRVAREGAPSRRRLPGPRAVPVRQRDRPGDLGRRRRPRARRRRQPGDATTPGCPRRWPSSCRATASRSRATGT